MARWTTANIPPLNGRSAVVTGAGGLGFEDALALARAGAEVIIAGRNQRRGRPARQQLLIGLHEPGIDLGILDAQICQQSLVDVTLFVEANCDLIDDFVAAPLPDFRLDLLRLIRANVVLGQDAFDRVQTVTDRVFVIGRAIAAEQIFKHVSGDVCPFLDELGEVLANDLASETLNQQVIHIVLGLQFRSHCQKPD